LGRPIFLLGSLFSVTVTVFVMLGTTAFRARATEVASFDSARVSLAVGAAPEDAVGLLVADDGDGGFAGWAVVEQAPTVSRMARAPIVRMARDYSASDSLERLFEYGQRVTEVPRRALLRPRSLAPEQYAPVGVTKASPPVAVDAWVVWEDGVEELLGADELAVAISWTSRAVLVRWGAPPRVLEAWVWAGAVSRR